MFIRDTGRDAGFCCTKVATSLINTEKETLSTDNYIDRAIDLPSVVTAVGLGKEEHHSLRFVP